MTDMEYSRNERSISKLISMGSMYPITSSPPDESEPELMFLRAMFPSFLDV